ncbi:MAG: chemotaxis response regulator protein-glutamate methylesterase [Acidobacteriia bacterium]|nr:chemotaxis response regulator protein-glutamate methylesterase [Terriglobia bacterium]
MRTALSRMIGSEPDIQVVGSARDGSEALEKIAALNPDVVTLDVEMPGLNGLETLRCIMAQSPRPVIMVSSATERDAEITFRALGVGAFDYVPKQLSSGSLEILHIRDDLIAKIKAAAQLRRPHAAVGIRKPPQGAGSSELGTLPFLPAVVAIGISTGGPKALQDMLPLLPPDLPVPILIVQHMPPGFTAPFAQRLAGLCSIAVREATHQEPIRPGVVYIAPAGIHMVVEHPPDSRPVIALTPEPANHLHVPSVDIMMNSVAETFGSLAMGIIMTGMGCDGALGMKSIHRHGGITVGQDEPSCVVYGMPRACAEMGILQHVVPLSKIPQQILRATRYRKHA